MTITECKLETIQHIEKVRAFIRYIIDRLTVRAVEHDSVKLESPEVELFAKLTPKLAAATYGSEEYHAFLKELEPALQHHYAHCRHHPEHFDRGINDMPLVDLVEMICDWKAASLRQNNGNLLKSIEINAKRFGYDDQLKQIFINTARLFEEM